MNEGWTELGQNKAFDELEGAFRAQVAEEGVGYSPGFACWASWDRDARGEEGSKCYF